MPIHDDSADYFYGYSDDNYDQDYDPYESSYSVRFCGDPLWVGETFSEWRLPLFSWCFQHAVLAQIPILFFFISLPALWMRYRTRGGVGLLPYDWLASMKYALALIMAADKFALLIRSLYQSIFDGDNVPLIEFIYPLINFLALTCIIATMNRCRSYGIISPGILFWTWLLFVVCSAPEFCVWLLIGTNPLTVNNVDFYRYLAFLIWFPVCCLQLFLHFFPDHVISSKYTSMEETDHEVRASFLGRHMLTWFTEVARQLRPTESSAAAVTSAEAAARVLPLPAGLSARTLFRKWRDEWARRVGRTRRVTPYYPPIHHCSRHEDGVQVGGDEPPAPPPAPLLTEADEVTPLVSPSREYGSLKGSSKGSGLGVSPGPDKKERPRQYPSIFWPLIRLQKWQLTYAIVFNIIADIAHLLGPVFLIELLGFVEDGTQPRWRGCGIALATFCSAQIASFAYNVVSLTVCRSRVAAHSMLVSAIYDKVLRLFADAPFARNRHALLSAISGDVKEAECTLPLITQLVSFILQAILGIFLVWHVVGSAAIVTLLFFLFFSYCNSVMAAPIAVAERNTAKKRSDTAEVAPSRADLTRELLCQERQMAEETIKGYVIAQIKRLRVAELKQLNHVKLSQSLLSVFNTAAAFIASYLTFFLYAWINAGNETIVLTATTIFVTRYLILILQRSFFAAAKLHRKIRTIRRANTRIARLLTEEELDETEVERDRNPDYERAIDIQLASFESGDSAEISRCGASSVAAAKHYRHSPRLVHEPFALNDVELHVKRGILVAVVAADGSDGGTQFLHAILGEMRKAYGYVGVRGRLAYCPRSTWLLHGDIRDNILLTHPDDEDPTPLDEERYACILAACELKAGPSLPAGDRTVLGVNVGQAPPTPDLCAQVALARAAYSDADVFLIEDLLSTMEDEGLAARLYTRLLDGDRTPALLAGRTRLVVGNRRKFVQSADLVVLVDERKVKFSGTYDELTRDENASRLFDRLTKKANDYSKALVLKPTPISICEADRAEANLMLLKTELTEVEEAVADSALPSLRHVGTRQINTSFFGVLVVSAIFMAGSVAFGIINQYWLSNWANPEWQDDTEISERFVVYFVIGIFVAISLAAGRFTTIYATTMISKQAFGVIMNTIRGQLSDSVLARMFYRSTRDMERVDKASKFLDVMLNASNIFFLLAVFVVRRPIFIVPIAVIVFVVTPVTRTFIGAATRLQLLNTIALDAILLRVDETVTGLRSIRAFDVSAQFFDNFERLVDRYSATRYARMIARRWMSVRMELVGCLFVLVVCLAAAFAPQLGLPPAFVGLFVMTSYQLADGFIEFSRKLAGVESEAASAERIFEIQSLVPPEKRARAVGKGLRPPSDWPSGGQLTIAELTCAPAVGAPIALENFSADFAARARIGVRKCGAASEALWAALIRRVEPAGGRVLVDGVDIAAVDVDEWRAHVTVISSMMPLLSGTLRFNLDPAGVRADADLWRAVDALRLRSFVEARQNGLETVVSRHDPSIKPRVRTSITLARAILRKRRILLLDDAQFTTQARFDKMVRSLLYEEFHDATIIHFTRRVDNLAGCDQQINLETPSPEGEGGSRKAAPPQDESSDTLAKAPDAQAEPLNAGMSTPP